MFFFCIVALPALDEPFVLTAMLGSIGRPALARTFDQHVLLPFYATRELTVAVRPAYSSSNDRAIKVCLLCLTGSCCRLRLLRSVLPTSYFLINTCSTPLLYRSCPDDIS